MAFQSYNEFRDALHCLRAFHKSEEVVIPSQKIVGDCPTLTYVKKLAARKDKVLNVIEPWEYT